VTTPDDIRAELRSWLASAWDPELALVDWRHRLLESGWATPTWPTEWFGRGLPGWADAVVAEELSAAGAVGPAVGVGTALAAPTLLAHGSDDIKRRLLPRAITGEDTWCQLFSEPGAGSDLAGLSTRATRDGDQWVVDGQKLWSTSAHHADLGLLLARTDWDVPKHQGLTCFALPMHQAGVEVRPLRQMNHYASFNEVFLTGAIAPGDHMIGEQGAGWRAAMTTLAHERGFATMRRRHLDASAGRAVREAAAEADEYFATYAWYPQRAGRPDLVVESATIAGRRDDPIARQRIAELLAMQRAHEWTARRARAARTAGPEGSLGKLGASAVARAAAATHGMLAGASGTVEGTVAEILTSVPAQSIAGGTDEIQRNIIGERVLGLPKEPS
jgi:alkylation response protein AidB-like acyl-CoA dehydrogenase